MADRIKMAFQRGTPVQSEPECLGLLRRHCGCNVLVVCDMGRTPGVQGRSSWKLSVINALYHYPVQFLLLYCWYRASRWSQCMPKCE